MQSLSQLMSYICVEFNSKTLHVRFMYVCLHSHLQDEGIAAGGFICVYQADHVGMLEPLEQIEFLSDPVSPH